MNDLLKLGGRIAGLIGLLLCSIAVIWRLLGNYYLIGFDLGTLLQAGTSAIVVACFLLLLGQAERR